VAQAVGLKRAEDALKQSEAQQRFILESLQLTIYSAPINPECDTKWISGDVKRITGFENEEYLSRDDFWRNRLHPDDKFTVLEAFKKLPLNKESVLEYRWKCKDGEYHWFHDRAVLLENDSVKEYLGIFLDITDRKRSEEILNQSEEKYRMFIDLAADAFFHGDSKGNLIEINNSAIELTGYSRDELLKMNMADLFSADYLTQKPLRYDLLVKGEVIKSEREITRKDGRSVFVEMNSKKMPDGNYQSFFRDVTRRRQATEELKAGEEKFRNIFEANTDGITIFLLIPEGGPSKIIDLNKNAAKMVGYTKEEMLLMKPEDLEIELTTEKIGKRKSDLITKGNSNFETTLLHKDGHAINVEINATVITYNNQSAIMNIVRDITERKQNEEVIYNKNEELRKLNAEKDKFFSIIAHDLRSPFNSFLGLTQIMAEELPNLTMSQLQKIADSMRNSATNLFSLLENLLLWSRVKQGLIPFNPEMVQLWQSVNLSISIVSEPALDKGIEITVSVPDDLQVFADVNMLQTVIRNLVSNAVKFTPKGGKVDVLARPSAHGAVEVLISDSGIGLSTGMMRNLFRIDEQTNRTGTEGEPSTGLGLILCKEFVERQGGKIWVESEEGKGSTFFFTIPCNPEPENQTEVFFDSSMR
jgi:PAS domain S-box-containing protein